jgi:hypothetical protein
MIESPLDVHLCVPNGLSECECVGGEMKRVFETKRQLFYLK